MREASVPIGPQPWRILLTCLIFIGLFVALCCRLHYLQVESAQDLTAMGVKQRLREREIPARRGGIFAADGSPMVRTHSTWTLKADPTWMDDKLRATVSLSALLDIPRKDLRAEFERNRNGRVLATMLSDEQKEAVEKLELNGIYLRREYHRQYIGGRLASHALGFVDHEENGVGGLEMTCNDLLRGRKGYERYHINARGRPMVERGYRRVDPSPGHNIYLTIVPAIQQRLQELMAECVDLHNPKGVCGMVVRPATGEILAMGSWPDFDPNNLGEDEIARRDLNIGLVYESGSTMKPLVAGFCVNEGVVRWNQVIDCENGSWKTRYRRRPLTSKAHGRLTVDEVVALSDNIGMAKMLVMLAERQSIARVHDWYRRFGFGQRTGVMLPGEQYGILPRLQRWKMGTVITASFGQGISVTPIQMVAAHAAVANNGVVMPLRLVDRLEHIDPETGAREWRRLPSRRDPRRILDASIADGIEASMVRVMKKGTGTKLQLDGYSSAGKTGTTDVLVNGRYIKRGGPIIGSFVGWAPAVPGKAAEVVAMVVVNVPREADGSPRKYPNYFGGRTGGPVVQKILQFSLEHLGVPRDEVDDDRRAR